MAPGGSSKVISQKVPRHQGDSTGIDSTGIDSTGIDGTGIDSTGVDGSAFDGSAFDGAAFDGADSERTATGNDRDAGHELHSPVPDSFDAVRPQVVPQSAPEPAGGGDP
jgi:hypothetical protein